MVATILLEKWATEELRHFLEYVGLTSAKRKNCVVLSTKELVIILPAKYITL
jgi:hypothetical protein